MLLGLLLIDLLLLTPIQLIYFLESILNLPGNKATLIGDSLYYLIDSLGVVLSSQLWLCICSLHETSSAGISIEVEASSSITEPCQ